MKKFDENRLTMISIEKLFPHPDNPRKDVGDVTELAESAERLSNHEWERIGRR